LLEKILPYGNSVLSGASITSNEQVTQLKKSNEELEAENKRVHEEKKRNHRPCSKRARSSPDSHAPTIADDKVERAIVGCFTWGVRRLEHFK